MRRTAVIGILTIITLSIAILTTVMRSDTIRRDASPVILGAAVRSPGAKMATGLVLERSEASRRRPRVPTEKPVVRHARHVIHHVASDPAPSTTTATATPPSTPATWQDAVDSLSWDASLMLSIAWCESRDDPDVTEPVSGAHGLFQQLGITTDDPFVQVQDAYALWQEQGYAAWDASRGCWG